MADPYRQREDDRAREDEDYQRRLDQERADRAREHGPHILGSRQPYEPREERDDARAA